MSARGPPTPMEIADRFDLTPSEAQAVADALGPINNLTSVGENVGIMLTEADGAAPQLLGVVLKNISKQVDLASSNTEMMAQALQFYIERQQGAALDLFFTPEEVATQVADDIRPLAEALDGLTPQQQ